MDAAVGEGQKAEIAARDRGAGRARRPVDEKLDGGETRIVVAGEASAIQRSGRMPSPQVDVTGRRPVDEVPSALRGGPDLAKRIWQR